MTVRLGETRTVEPSPSSGRLKTFPFFQVAAESEVGRRDRRGAAARDVPVSVPVRPRRKGGHWVDANSSSFRETNAPPLGGRVGEDEGTLEPTRERRNEDGHESTTDEDPNAVGFPCDGELHLKHG